MKDRKRKEAVIFDMDGVIFDSETLVFHCWNVVAEKYGIKNVEEVCTQCLGINAVETKERFLTYYGKEFPYEVYKKEMAELFHKTAAEGGLELKPGVTELLAFLKEHEYKIALASSTRKAVVESELTAAGIIQYFDQIVCGDMVKKSKPEPDIYLTAAEKIGVTPNRCYAVEDSYNGIRSAHRAGMDVIMVPDMLAPNKEMEEICCHVFDSLFQVITLLQEKHESADFLREGIPCFRG